jgi:addiction module RelE/StbE family toxin
MNISFSPELDKELNTIAKKDRLLFKKIQKALVLFEQNPRHPSLRIHKLTGQLNNIWSLSVDISYRMLYLQDEEDIYFFDFGTHDEVYRK